MQKIGTNRAGNNHHTVSPLRIHSSARPMTNVEDRSVWSKDLCQRTRSGTSRQGHQSRCSTAILPAEAPSRAGTKVHPRPWNHLVLRGSPSEKEWGRVAVPEDFPLFVARWAHAGWIGIKNFKVFGRVSRNVRGVWSNESKYTVV